MNSFIHDELKSRAWVFAEDVRDLKGNINDRKGGISFELFMQKALYDPLNGYYMRHQTPFGVSGDFITAPELTPLFGQCLGHQCAQILPHLTTPSLLEFGAGEGRLCVELLKYLEQSNQLPAHYFILEVSGYLKLRQQALIEKEIPSLASRVQWLDALPITPFNGIIIANEVLDAMPVHRFLYANEQVHESFIYLSETGALEECFLPTENSRLNEQVRALKPYFSDHYQSEVNLYIEPWLDACAKTLMRGAILLIDYGFPRHEYYHPDRNKGTLMCHYAHQSHTNPLIHIGEQDITAHVDFTAVAEAADKAGLHVSGYTTQCAFLLNNGLLSLLPDDTRAQTYINAVQAIKKLTQPHEMGELFKVMGLTKNLDIDMVGFIMHDKRASL